MVADKCNCATKVVGGVTCRNIVTRCMVCRFGGESGGATNNQCASAQNRATGSQHRISTSGGCHTTACRFQLNTIGTGIPGAVKGNISIDRRNNSDTGCKKCTVAQSNASRNTNRNSIDSDRATTCCTHCATYTDSTGSGAVPSA